MYLNSSYEGTIETGSLSQPFKNIYSMYDALKTLNGDVLYEVYAAPGTYFVDAKPFEATRHVTLKGTQETFFSLRSVIPRGQGKR
jgi:hypothetical protein